MSRVTQRKVRIGWFSPVNLPEKTSSTLSAYTTDLLLPQLRNEFDITVFHSGFQQYQDYKTAHFLSAAEQHSRDPFDLFFYQLEDHPESNFIRQYCGVMPGAIWFHDFLFTSHGPEPILNSPFEDVIEHFNSDTCDFRERGHEYKERERSGIREAGLSVLRVFSREIAHSECKRRVSSSLTFQEQENRILSAYLPVPIPDVSAPLFDAEDQFRILFCGSVQVEHRAHKLFQAIAALDPSTPVVWLCSLAEQHAAEELIKEYGLSSVQLLPERSPKKWQQLVEERGWRSVAAHIHFSVYGQTAPYLQMSLAAGLPTLISDFGGAEFLPDSLTFKIEPGQTESSQIQIVLEELLSKRVHVDSSAAADFARENFSKEQIGRELSFMVRQALPVLSEMNARWGKLHRAARDEVLDFALSVHLKRAEEDLFPQTSAFENSATNSSVTLASEQLQEIFQELGFSK
ncbi:MAG: glycosyltransferase [Bdellovibrionales bacterium]|nr:glycosyltransferase [Bdellovibrionales bacterium]